jgi:hypothetical protein
MVNFFAPSIEPSSLPSALPSVLPSFIPSSAPSYFCPIDEFLGKTYFAPCILSGTPTCVKIELFAGGVISIDDSSPNCINTVFQKTSTLSDFDGVSGNFAMFKGCENNDEWTGYIAVKEDPSIVDVELQMINDDTTAFAYNLVFPSCTLPLMTSYNP